MSAMLQSPYRQPQRVRGWFAEWVEPLIVRLFFGVVALQTASYGLLQLTNSSAFVPQEGLSSFYLSVAAFSQRTLFLVFFVEFCFWVEEAFAKLKDINPTERAFPGLIPAILVPLPCMGLPFQAYFGSYLLRRSLGPGKRAQAFIKIVGLIPLLVVYNLTLAYVLFAHFAELSLLEGHSTVEVLGENIFAWQAMIFYVFPEALLFLLLRTFQLTVERAQALSLARQPFSPSPPRQNGLRIAARIVVWVFILPILSLWFPTLLGGTRGELESQFLVLGVGTGVVAVVYRQTRALFRAPRLTLTAEDGMIFFFMAGAVVAMTPLIEDLFSGLIDVDPQRTGLAAFSTLLGALAYLVLKPVVEETLFRGILLDCLKDRFGWLAAAVVSTLAYVFSRPEQDLFPHALLLSICCLVIRYKTDSVYGAILVHFASNIFLWMLAKGSFLKVMPPAVGGLGVVCLALGLWSIRSIRLGDRGAVSQLASANERSARAPAPQIPSPKEPIAGPRRRPLQQKLLRSRFKFLRNFKLHGKAIRRPRSRPIMRFQLIPARSVKPRS